jgi:predicted transcriptional regulator of viral defense system
MTHHDIISLSDTEASLFTTLAARAKDIFTVSDAYAVAGERRATRETLERLVEKGWLERIEKGKYLIVPLEAGPDRTWTHDAFVVAGHLVTPSMVAYWSALGHWNLTDQVPRITYVQTTARKENRSPEVLGMQFRIVRVKPRKFFGEHVQHILGAPAQVTDREKTIIDCLDRPDLSGGVPEVAKALVEGDGEYDWGRMTEYLGRFGSGAVVKRLGFLIEALRLPQPPDEDTLKAWQRSLTAGISALDPSSPRRAHRIATRWRIEVNLPEDGLGGAG